MIPSLGEKGLSYYPGLVAVDKGVWAILQLGSLVRMKIYPQHPTLGFGSRSPFSNQTPYPRF